MIPVAPPSPRHFRWKGLAVASLGTFMVWILWPLIWMLLTSPALKRQERDAAALFAAAPQVYFTGKLVKVSGSPDAVPGLYMMRSEQSLDDHLTARGWTFKEQMGAGRLYRRPGQRLDSTCRLFTGSFNVCTVSPPE